MSTRKRPASTPKYPNLVACMGDSLTHNYTTQVNLAEFWPTRLAAALTEAGADSRAKNCGTSGNTTGMMWGRVSALTNDGVPDLAVLFGGVNDPGSNGLVQASPIPTATSFALASGEGARFSAGCWINVNDTTANAGSAARQVQSVVGDVITLTMPLASAPAAGSVIRNDTYLNLGMMIDALAAVGCDKILVVSAQYKNFASGGDTLSIPYAPYVPVRTAQSAIAAAKGAMFVDLYAYMRSLIVEGTIMQGNDTAWHVAVSDQHLNAVGEQIVADAVMSTVEGVDGWIEALSAA